MSKMGKRVLWGFMLALGLQAQAAVWVDSNRWDQNWEDQYSSWVKNSFNEDIFTSGKYKGIATDCADAVYLSRAIFAFENRLPFVVLDPTGGETKISNRMSRYDGASEMSKFRRFAEYISEMTDTKSLPRDTYPLQISREYLRAGAVWSRVRIRQENIFSFLFGGTVKEDPGHAEVVKDVTETGAVQLIGSTVPSDVRKLISTTSLVFMPVETSTGFRKWMQPDWYGRPQKDLPGFSMEQFEIGKGESNSSRGRGEDFGAPTSTPRNLQSWQQQVQAKLQLRTENKEETLQRYGSDLCNLVQARVKTILQSEKKRLEYNGACMNAEDYDSYSTPSRDKRIYSVIADMVSIGGGFGFTVRGRVDRVRQYMESCPAVAVSASQSLSLFDIAKAYAEDRVSSDPNDVFGARWGTAPKDDSRRCPTY